MTAIAVFFSEWTGNLAICLTIIIACMLSLEAYFRHTRHIARQLRKANALLETNHGTSTMTIEERKVGFVKNWSHFQSGIEMPEMKIFASPWAEFLKNLHVPRPDAHLPIRSLAEPVLYFNENSLFHAHVDSRLYDAIPGFLARGGILGTFIGLVSGIFLVQGGFTAGEAEMKLALGQLMGGASTAFNASIVGISLSVLYSVLEKRRRYKTLRLVRRFSELLESVLEVSPPENSALIKIHEIQVAQLAELQKQSAHSKASTASQINSIATVMNSAIGKLTEALVSQKNERLQSDQWGLQQLITQLSEQMRSDTRSHITSFQDAIWKQHESLVSTLKNLLESGFLSGQGTVQEVGKSIRASLDETNTKLHTHLQESSGTFTIALEKILAGLEQARLTMQSIQYEMQRGLEANQGALQQVGQQMGQAVHHSFEDTQRKLSLHLQESSGTFTVALEKILAGLEQTRLTMQSMQYEMQRGLEANQGALQQVGQRVGQTVHDAFEETQRKWSLHLQESSDTVAASIERMVEGLTRLAMQGIQHEMQRGLEVNQSALQQVTKTVQDSFENTQRKWALHQQESSEVFVVALERILAGLDQTRIAMQGIQREMQRGLEANHGALQQVGQQMGQTVQNSFDDTQRKLSVYLQESSGTFVASLERILAGLDHAYTVMQENHRETQRILVTTQQMLSATNLLLHTFDQHDTQSRSMIDQRFMGLGEWMTTLTATLHEQNAAVALARKDQSEMVRNDMRDTLQHTGGEMVTQLMSVVSELSIPLRLASTELSDAADRLKTIQETMSTHMQGLLGNLGGTMDRFVAGLTDTHTARDATQENLSSLLQRFDQTLGVIAENVSSMNQNAWQLQRADASREHALQTLSSFLAESREILRAESSLGDHLVNVVSTLEQTTRELGNRLSGTLDQWTVGNREVFSGLNRTADQTTTKMDQLLSVLERQSQYIGTTPEGVLQELTQFLTDFRDTLRTESVVSNRLLSAVSALERASQELGNRLVTAINQLTAGTIGTLSESSHTNDQIITQGITQVGEMVSSLLASQQGLQNLLASIPQIVQQPLGRIEENTGNLHRLFEQMETISLAAFKTFHDGQQSAQFLQQSQQQLGIDNAALQDIIYKSSTTFYHAANSLTQAAEQVIQAFGHSSRMSETTRLSMDGIQNFSATFDQAQHRFMQMIEAMESGATMIAIAGDKFQSGTRQLENVASSLVGVEDSARQTFTSITNAHEQLRTIWHNYNARFSQVDTSLEQTFIHLNNGLTEFSKHVIHFIAGLDDHTGAITEKLGSVVGEFGSKLDDLNDTMSDFLNGMSGKLVSPMQDASVQIARAGERIYTNLQQFDRLSDNMKEFRAENQKAISAISGTPEQIEAAITKMQQQWASGLGNGHDRLEQLHGMMQNTVSRLNSEVHAFSSERVLEFVGGVDEHMEQLSTQLGELLRAFNDRLDILNESMDSFVHKLVTTQ